MDELSFRLELNDAIEWIHDNKFKRVVIELKQEDIIHASIINQYVIDGLKKKATIDKSDLADVYITRSNSCSVDMVVTQHISDIDAILHLGQICLTKFQLKNQDTEPAIFYSFGRMKDQVVMSQIEKLVMDKIDSIKQENNSNKLCIFYDTCLLDIAIMIAEKIGKSFLKELCDVARLDKISEKWHTSEYHASMFTSSSGANKYTGTFGHFITSRSLEDYTHAIYIGDRLSITSILNFAGSLYRIHGLTTEPVIEEVQKTRLLYKRVALVDQIKDQEELKIGVILTNPLPDVPKVMERLHMYAEQRKHTLYFITMIQTIDECKIGNFDLCDAFVIINSCTCSTILESLCFNRPIISEIEFKLACGYEVEYGKVLWPGTSTHSVEDDLINRRKVSDVSLALIHTRNELLERCSQARVNKWSGLDYNKATGDGEDHEESLRIEDGLHGIASSYVSEPHNN